MGAHPGQANISKTVALPGNAAGLFSMGMMAVLAAIRDMADKQGWCTATNAHIAEIAGVGQSMMRKAINRAHSIELIRYREHAHRQARDHQQGHRSAERKRMIVNRGSRCQHSRAFAPACDV
jgi:hypothetical protein